MVRDGRGSRYAASHDCDGPAIRSRLAADRAAGTKPQIQNDPDGGIVRVAGGLGRFNETVCDLYREEVFPADVVLCFNCFVSGNTSVSWAGPHRRPYPIEISRLQAAKRSTPAPLSRSASCLRA